MMLSIKLSCQLLRSQLSGIAITALCFLLSSCSQPGIPTELKLETVLYDTSQQFSFGPAGLNKGFVIYELKDDVLRQVELGGVAFLNAMPSAVNYKPKRSKPGYEGSVDRFSFIQWQTLPIPQDKNWNWSSSYPRYNKNFPVLADYFGDYPHLLGAEPPRNFSETIDIKVREQFQTLIQGNNGYFSYGGFRGAEVLVVVPTEKKIYHLFKR